MHASAASPNALVTGGAGFIGSHLTESLLAEGWRVTVVDDFNPFYDPNAKRRNLAQAASHPQFRLVERSLTAPDLDDALGAEPFTAIVHLAALAGVRPSIDRPDSYVEANVDGTLQVLELARRRGVGQFVLASSSSVYGVNPRVPWSESDHDLMPISPYAATKIAGEAMARVYAHLHGIRAVALRFFTVYGPRQRPDLAIHKFAKRMLAGEPIPFYGDGSTQRDYTFVGDTVKGIRAAMTYDGADYDVFNLGNDRVVSLAELVQALEKAVGVPAILDRQPAQAGDVPATWADISHARARLGYEPSTPLAEGLDAFVAWLKSQPA
ncbi:MAG: NAD-dependent epimerase/dehydratase family protein [Fimbriimonas sp.]